MTIRSLVTLVALLLAVGLGGASTGCTDESDACKAYCARAAECLDCGGNISLAQCQQACVDLSFDQQRKLADCAKDCPNVYACQQMVGFPPPTPCVY